MLRRIVEKQIPIIKHEERELRIVDVKETLSVPQILKLAPRESQPARLTNADALEDLRSMKGADALIKRIPALGDIAVWHEVAYWAVCESSGSALVHDGPLYWDHDDQSFNLQFNSLNCWVNFIGRDTFLGPTGQPITPPQNLSGQVWCELDAPAEGYYLFVANLYRVFEGGPSIVEFCIDHVSLGQAAITLGTGGSRHSFLLHLPLGRHRFLIKQVDGAFAFRSVSAWHVPSPSHA
jgi:hypothetical protein